MSKSDDAQLKKARDQFKLGYDADDAQRKADIEALRMFALDQWPDAVLQSRQAQQPNGIIPGTPARPCLVVDKLREPVNQIVNQERESDLAVEIVAADDFGGITEPIDPAEIELREGLIRRIQRESESASARTWAFQRAAITGRGYYAINTRYAKGKTFDQEIYCRRLFNQSCVVLDPAHEEPDGSDAEWGFIFTVLSYDAYKAEFPRAVDGKNRNVDCSESDWASLVEHFGDDGWFTQDGEKKYVRIAEHWYTEFDSKVLAHLDDGNAMWEDELPEGVKPRATRHVIERKVKWCKMDGCQFLDKTDWPSPFVPIIKIVGNEIPPHDEKRRVDGLVNKSAIESQRGVNYMASKLAEEIGLSTVAPLMVAEGTVEGYEAWWDQASTRPFTRLPYKQKDLEGNVAPPPFRPDKSVAVAPIAAGLQMFLESIQASTGVTDPQMGKPSRFSETWRGTQALINQGQRGTSNFMDNLARSVRYEGRIMDSLLYPIYGTRPGRLARIVKGEGEAETVMIGQPFMMQDNGQGQQRPVPAPPGATGQMEGVREYKLTEHANFNVAIKVTKGYDTRRQEEGAVLGEILAQQPQFMSVFGDLWLAAQDWPGAKEAKDRMELMLDPKIIAFLESQKGGQPTSPMVLQLQQQLQQTTQAAQQMQMELQTRAQETQMKIQSEQQLAQLKAQAEIELATIKANEAIQVAQIKAGVDLQKGQEKNEADLVKQSQAHLANVRELLLEAELTPEPQPEAQQV